MSRRLPCITASTSFTNPATAFLSGLRRTERYHQQITNEIRPRAWALRAPNKEGESLSGADPDSGTHCSSDPARRLAYTDWRRVDRMELALKAMTLISLALNGIKISEIDRPQKFRYIINI